MKKRGALALFLAWTCLSIAAGSVADELGYNDVGAHRFWRLIAKYHFGLWAINELQFLDRSGDLLATKRRDPGNAVCSGDIRSYGHSSFAFDGTESSYWLSGEEDGSDLYIGYDFGHGNEKEVVRYRLMQYSHDVYRVAYVELQYSDDGNEWTTSFNRPTTPISYELVWEDSHAPCNDQPASCGYNGTTCLNGGDGPFKEGHTVEFVGNCDTIGEGFVRGGATSAVCKAGADNHGWMFIGSGHPPSCGTCTSGTCIFQDGTCDVEKKGAACNWVYWEPMFASTPLGDLPRLTIDASIQAAAAGGGGEGGDAGVVSLRCGTTYEVDGVLSTDPVEVCLPGQISSELISQYEDHGHLCVEGLFDTSEIDAYRPYLRAYVEQLAGAFLDATHDAEEEAQHPLSQIEDSKEFLLAPNLRDRAAGLNSEEGDESSAAELFTEGTRLLSAAATLLAVPAEEVCVWFDRAFFKEPGDSPTHWHRDSDANRIPETVTYLTAWVPLVNIEENMGVLKFERGSHGADKRFDGHGPPKAGATLDHRTYSVGDVSFHHGHLKHASFPNRSPVVREAYAVMYAVYPRAGDGSTRCAKDEDYVGI